MSLNVLGDLVYLSDRSFGLGEFGWLGLCAQQENGCVVSGTVQSGIRGITSVVAWYF